MRKVTIKIYYDATCHICTVAAKHAADSGITSIKIVDALPPGIDKEAAMKEVYAVDKNGKIYKGADAVLHIMSELPRWRLISKIAKIPGIYYLTKLVYRFVAIHRHRF